MTKVEKNDMVNELIEDNKDMNKEIGDKTYNAKTIQKARKNYIKKVKDKKIEQDKINKEYLRYIQPGKKNYNDDDIDESIEIDKFIEIDEKNVTKIDNLTNNEMIKQIFEICGEQKDNGKLTKDEKNRINKILTNNNKDSLGPTASNKSQVGLWLLNRSII